MRITFISIITLLTITNIQAQSQKDWFHFPGFDPALPTTLTDKETLVGVLGLAAISYSLEEFLFKKHNNVNYYSFRAGMNKEYAWGLKNVWHQNAGIEHQPAPWFAVSASFNLQQWNDNSPHIETDDRFGLGLGLMTYYRWYLFGKKRFKPYIEYGIGIFQGFKEFPYNGSKFSFNHSSQLGFEYVTKNKNKVRLGYGNFHQTNYNILDSNPSYTGYGFSLSYSYQIQ